MVFAKYVPTDLEEYEGSESKSLPLAVGIAPTTISISAPPVTYNAAGIVTVSVTSTVIPSGNVSLSVDGGGSITQTLSGGSSTFTLPSPAAGIHSLYASFAAQGNLDWQFGNG